MEVELMTPLGMEAPMLSPPDTLSASYDDDEEERDPFSVDEYNDRSANSASQYVTQEEDELMSEMILKHRTELQKFVEAAIPVVTKDGSPVKNGVMDDMNRDDQQYLPNPENVQNIPPDHQQRSSHLKNGITQFQDNPSSLRPQSMEELSSDFSRTERQDRMRLAELSDVRNERIGRQAILKWNPNAKKLQSPNNPYTQEKSRSRGPTPTKTTPKMLRAYTKDYVQQAIDFNNTEDDDELFQDVDYDDEQDYEGDELLSPTTMDAKDGRRRTPKSVHKHVKQMELTIAQLRQQKEELIRNQQEFDKHASGIFPTLEVLNNQLSQIVQERMLQSQVTLKDDFDNELRGVLVRLNDMESEAKIRRQEAELMEQKRQMEIGQIKGEIASLGTTGTLHTQKMELMSSQVENVQQELQTTLKIIRGVLKTHSLIETRVSTLQTLIDECNGRIDTTEAKVKQKEIAKPIRWIRWTALLIVVVAVIMWHIDDCMIGIGRCPPIT